MNTAATTNPTLLETMGTTGIIAGIAAVLVVVLTAYFTASAARRKSRAERYAAMVVSLTAWTELPYRVRRRPSDDPSVMAALVDRMHGLHEQVVLDSAELAAECPWLGKRYERALVEIKAIALPYLNEAWASPAVGTAAGMNLNGWGPTGLNTIVLGWRSELRWRFGWRRLVNPVRLAWNWRQNRQVTAAPPNAAGTTATP
jgi:hypothetical protein